MDATQPSAREDPDSRSAAGRDRPIRYPQYRIRLLTKAVAGFTNGRRPRFGLRCLVGSALITGVARAYRWRSPVAKPEKWQA